MFQLRNLGAKFIVAYKRGLKLSTKPSPEIADGLKSLAKMQSCLSDQSYDPTRISEALVGFGVTHDTMPIMETLKSQHAQWVSELQTKVNTQLVKLGDDVTKLKLPVYNCTDPATQNTYDDDFVKNWGSCLKPASEAVAALKGFIAAVQFSLGLANVSVDLSSSSSLLSDGQLFIYSFTLVTIVTSPTWRTVSRFSLICGGCAGCGWAFFVVMSRVRITTHNLI